MACNNKPQKTCSQCHHNMICDIQQGKSTCWCFELPNIMPVEETTGGCLCRECLESAIEKQNNQFQSQSKTLTQYR